MNLRESARDCPYCMFCQAPNPNGDLLCLAHSNALADGRGAYFKTPDDKGAIVCFECHEVIDGRKGGLPRAMKREIHKVAHERTLRWWESNGYIKLTTRSA